MNFSIVIPTLNEERALGSCLNALLTLPANREIIVVDGGSTDNTPKLAKVLADKVLFAAKGRASQMNAGAKNASGDVLIFLHADTFLPEDALQQIEQALNANRCWGRFDVRFNCNHPMLKIVAFCMNWRSRMTGIATGDQAIFVEKRCFDSMGGYPVIALMEDIALSKMLKKISPPACLFSQVNTSARRWEQFGIFNTILLMWNLRLRYFLGEEPTVLALMYQSGKFWKR